VRLTPEARAAMLADRSDEMLEGYRRLAETLGPTEPAVPPAPRTPPGPESWLRWPASAWAQDGGDDAGVRAALERFRLALQSEDVDALAEVLGGMSPAQRTAYQAYFANADKLSVELGRTDIVIAGNDALATFTRRDVFIDVATGREMRLEARLTCVLVKRDGRWRITALQKPS
jgi:ketosteroid isomerase-like protein